MTRNARSRSRPHVYQRGVADSEGGIGNFHNHFDFGTNVQTDFVLDSHGRPVVDSPFSSSQFSGKLPAVTGYWHPTFTTLASKITLTDAVFQPPSSNFTNLVPLDAPSGWMLSLVAGTNPSRPILTIPELIEDIVDLPKALKALGELILHPVKHLTPKGLSGEYLGVQFGWLPLIEDLTKLLDLQRYVIKRNKELNQLYSGRGMRRRLSFADDTVAYEEITNFSWLTTSALYNSNSLLVKRRSWATIHWYPTTPPPYHPDDESQNRFTRRLLLGATPEALAKGLWAVIPWTWLLGWFTNFGQYTLAYSWTVPATHGNGCFMSEVVATLSPGVCTATNAIDQSFTVKGEAIHTYRTRIVGTEVTAGVNMPYLDMFRLSILGSLWIQRFAGRWPS